MVIDLRYHKLHDKYVRIVTQWLINQTQRKREKSARRWYMFSGAAERGFGMRVERKKKYPFVFPTSPARRSLSIFAIKKRKEKKKKRKEKQEKEKERKERNTWSKVMVIPVLVCS